MWTSQKEEFHFWWAVGGERRKTYFDDKTRVVNEGSGFWKPTWVCDPEVERRIKSIDWVKETEDTNTAVWCMRYWQAVEIYLKHFDPIYESPLEDFV